MIDKIDASAATDRRHRRGWVLAVAAGVALGVANSSSNVFGSAYGPYTTIPGQGVLWLEYLSAWVGSAGAWALFAFAVGWLTRRPGAAAIWAVLGLLSALVAYYLCDAARGMTDRVAIYPLVFWSLLALLVAPVMAVLGVLAQANTRWSLLRGLLAPMLLVYDAATRPAGPAHVRPWSQWLVYAAAAGLALALTARAAALGRQPRGPRLSTRRRLASGVRGGGIPPRG